MRFILDTNILIPLEDSQISLGQNLARIVRLANEHGHQLVYHAASEDDIRHDPDTGRRNRTLDRLRQYVRLDGRPVCPWNSPTTSENDAADNEILYALHCDAAHALITEDRGIHDKARLRGLVDRVYTIQTAEDLLRRLHEAEYIRLPNIEDVPLHSLTANLQDEFFESLREAYAPFDTWFRECARQGRRAWVYWEGPGQLGAICIYARQDNEVINDGGRVLAGPALKLSTFKVASSCRGRKIGELFLKATFRYATVNRLEHVFVHGHPERQHFLFQLLEDFGFESSGMYRGDAVYVKQHPSVPPVLGDNPFEYHRRFYPHFKRDEGIGKFIVPIRPEYHRVLFPDYESPADMQIPLFRISNTAGNAIKLAYLSHAQTSRMSPGDVVLFYRSQDERAITSIGVVEDFTSMQKADEIARKVSRRTVYAMSDIVAMARKPTKVMLFRLVRHVARPLELAWLNSNGLVNGNIQSIRELSHERFERIIEASS